MTFALTVLSYLAAMAAGVYAGRSVRLLAYQHRVASFFRRLAFRLPW